MSPTARLLAAAAFSGATLLAPLANAQTAAPAVQLETRDGWLVDRRLLAVGAGAIAGVVVFNVLAAPFGTVPFAGGTLQAVPYSVALGSRLIATVSAGAGALGATWLYDKVTGYRTDYSYALALGAGAIAGVAVGNVLGMGILGNPPYYAGAGLADATGAVASTAAQAASRVYVIGSGVIGAWVADFLYRR